MKSTNHVDTLFGNLQMRGMSNTLFEKSCWLFRVRVANTSHLCCLFVIASGLCVSVSCGPASGERGENALTGTVLNIQIKNPEDGSLLQIDQSITCEGVASIPSGYRLPFGEVMFVELQQKRGGQVISVTSKSSKMERAGPGFYRFAATIDPGSISPGDYSIKASLDVIEPHDDDDDTERNGLILSDLATSVVNVRLERN